ncbi:unnamed protein product [Withania somnifera]
MYTRNDTHKAFRYTPDQVRKMEESNQIRKQLEPVQLIEVLKGLKEEFLVDEKVVQVPQHIKQKIADEILAILKGVNTGDNATGQRGVLAQSLDVDWPELSEEIGLWIPVAIISKEHHDKPEGEEKFGNEIIAGRRLPPECKVELHTDYGGDAVRWGLTHPKESAFECCMACLNQAKHAGPIDKKCNIWVYCPSETGCYSPDIYQHKHQECWLKYAEKPKMTFKERYSESFRNAHPNAPAIVPWMAGVVNV